MKGYIKVIIGFILFCMIGTMAFATATNPVARFQFAKDSYELGEDVEVVDLSYSQVNNTIVKREWRVVINNTNKTSSSLKNLVSSLKIGEHEIFLRVRDSAGIWSDWTSNKLKIVTPIPIKITNLRVSKSSYAQGEKLDLTYTLDNPKDLDIKAQRWRYKNLTTGGSTISGKPRYLKKAGTYEITLQIQDERGNWSNTASCKVVINEEQKERNGAYLFNEGTQGDLIDGYVDKDYNTFEPLTNTEWIDLSGTLIMSNSPETIPSSGILYKDSATGQGRILVHHANGTNYNKKLMILATTMEETPVKLTVNNEAIQGPSIHILPSGQTSVREYFKGSSQRDYMVKKGEYICLYDSSKKGYWQNEQIITGLLDFYAERNVTFIVVAMDYTSSIENMHKLAVLPADGVHIRGTFDTIQREYTIFLENLIKSSKLVLGSTTEEWLSGKDALTGKTVQNKGNYGLSIRIKVQTDRDVGIILNARGGGYLGALKWNNSKVFNVPGEDLLSSQKVAALVGTTKAGTASEILYMLPNGSSAPVLFGFIPENLWEK